MKVKQQHKSKEKTNTIVQRKANKSFVRSRADDNSFTKPLSSSKSSKKLPKGLQSNMEKSLGQDFSNVSIHTNSQQAVQMNARAYTQEEHVHFAPGEFNPNSSKGKNLIGHEFTHVAQQRAGVVQSTKVLQKGIRINDSNNLESEADSFGKKAVKGESVAKYKSTSSNTQNTARTTQTKSNVVQAKFALEGATADLRNKFLKKINSSSMKFDMDASGNITKRKASDVANGQYEKVMESAVQNAQIVKFRLIAKSDTLFMDSFASGKVDASDMVDLPSDLFQINMIHILAERFSVADYEKNKRTAGFRGAHKKGLDAEEKFLKEKYPKKTIKYIGAGIDNSTKKVDKAGTGTVDYYFDFTDVKHVYTQSIVKGKLIEDVVGSRFEIVR
ncbi:DUF4157 domain-containing protein [Kordia sp.]|uniref:eCIS core domain-containing protein n=1 Tax=Kordia sp. TaxID=1965332 RepID=UPI003B5B8C59